MSSIPGPGDDALITSLSPGLSLTGGRYTLDAKIASGGMAQVWRGFDHQLDRPVAIKVLHPHLADDDAFVKRFRREAVASASLSHRGVVAVYDTISEPATAGGAGVEAIVMELIEGQTLRDILDQRGVLPPSEVIALGVQIAEGLEAAHMAGIVHRDIKPANIMVTPTGEVKVTDFGIAKAATDPDLTTTGMLLGTAKYLAPEQVSGERTDPRSDLYSLGVVLFEALTSSAPFRANTDAATALARLHHDAPPVRMLAPTVSPALEDVIGRTLARDPRERLPTAAALAAALRRIGPAGAATDPGDPGDTGVMPLPGASERGITDTAPHPTTATISLDTVPGPAGAPGSPGGRMPPAYPNDPIYPNDPDDRGPAGAAAASGPAGLRRPAVAGAVEIALIADQLNGRSFLRDGDHDAAADPTTASSVAPAPDTTPVIVSATSFDPVSSDRTEREDRVGLAIDGDPGTSWRTETYRQANLGGLKSGVGLILTLEQPTVVNMVTIETPTVGWSAEVYVGDDLANRDRTDPAATISNGQQQNTVTLDPAVTGSEVMIWVTETGTTGGEHRFELSEVSLG
ncbi:MAG: protein kinase domain-containing protein [Acidimicrobiales bacterium]